MASSSTGTRGSTAEPGPSATKHGAAGVHVMFESAFEILRDAGEVVHDYEGEA